MLVGVMPWTQAGLTESPFVRVFETVRIPHAGGVDEFCGFDGGAFEYEFESLSDFADDFFAFAGWVCAGIYRARKCAGRSVGGVAGVERWDGDRDACGIAISGNGVCVYVGRVVFWRAFWLVHYFSYASGFPAGAGAGGARIADALCAEECLEFVAGLLAILGALISTWWIPGMKITIYAGLPWLVLITLCYFLWARGAKAARADADDAKGKSDG